MEKKAYLKPETEVLAIGLSSTIANTSPDSKVIDVTTNLGDNKLKMGGAGTSDIKARGNERNADGLNDWNIKLW